MKFVKYTDEDLAIAKSMRAKGEPVAAIAKRLSENGATRTPAAVGKFLQHNGLTRKRRQQRPAANVIAFDTEQSGLSAKMSRALLRLKRQMHSEGFASVNIDQQGRVAVVRRTEATYEV